MVETLSFALRTWSTLVYRPAQLTIDESLYSVQIHVAKRGETETQLTFFQPFKLQLIHRYRVFQIQSMNILRHCLIELYSGTGDIDFQLIHGGRANDGGCHERAR